MTPQQIEKLVQQYVKASLWQGEEERSWRTVDDDQREAIISGLDDALDNTRADLMGNSYERIAETAEGLLVANRVTSVPAGSPDYQRLCRRLLQAQQDVLRTEIERWNGVYRGDGEGEKATALPLLPLVLPTDLLPSRLLDSSRRFSKIISLITPTVMLERTKRRTLASVASWRSSVVVRIPAGDRQGGLHPVQGHVCSLSSAHS